MEMEDLIKYEFYCMYSNTKNLILFQDNVIILRREEKVVRIDFNVKIYFNIPFFNTCHQIYQFLQLYINVSCCGPVFMYGQKNQQNRKKRSSA